MTTIATKAPHSEADEIKGFSRTIAEIEWLLVILVMLYQVVRSPDDASVGPIYLGLLLFSVFVIGFRYFNISRSESRWKLAIETLVMIILITWVIYHTGRLESPLFSLYTLTIVTSALTLGKLATLLEVALIAACYLFLGASSSLENLLSIDYLSDFMTRFAPLLLVAYITTMLSADIHNALTRLKLISQTDELTGIYNVRAFAAVLERAHREAVRYKTNYSILMIDSDNLKMVNDHYGHESGNKLIRMNVDRIQFVLRDSDVVARYGGDEFIVLLPQTGPAGALEVAERIRNAIESTPLETESKQIIATVSIGIASFPEHAGEAATVMDYADQALYKSKEQGRNRTTIHSTC
jgi:diguanylate cyclase (GGDEF)-like protein